MKGREVTLGMGVGAWEVRSQVDPGVLVERSTPRESRQGSHCTGQRVRGDRHREGLQGGLPVTWRRLPRCPHHPSCLPLRSSGRPC